MKKGYHIYWDSKLIEIKNSDIWSNGSFPDIQEAIKYIEDWLGISIPENWDGSLFEYGFDSRIEICFKDE